MRQFIVLTAGVVTAIALGAGAASAKFSPYDDNVTVVESPHLAAPIEMRAQYEAAPERTYFEAPGARFRPQLPCRFNRVTDRFWSKATACN